MNEKRIVIDAGHGGSDPGASGNGIIEKDLNLAISNYMYDRFEKLGIPVKIIRTTDETIDPSERVNRILNAYGNNDDVIVISNHINAGSGEGAEVIYALRNTSVLPNLVLEKLANKGQIIRKAYQRRLPSDTSLDYYFIQRETGKTQPITVEYGFLDTKDDATRLKNNYEAYADAVVEAVLEYIKEPVSETTYIVKSGDSLWSIAKKYAVTVDSIKEKNNLTSNLLRIGQTLKIPSTTNEPVTNEYIVYTIKSGDTLYNIASKYNSTVSQLMAYNNLTTNLLSIGDTIKIPQTVSKTEPNSTNENTITYTVKSGDNLYGIAKKYNTTISEIQSLNNLNSTNLSINQKLLIPIINSNIKYTVKSGDSLYSIAKKYNTTVNSIKEKNNLATNLLSIGQILII